MKFIHVTDTHLVPPGRLLYGLDPRERLKACIADINRHHRDAALAVITGDLAHWGEIDAYYALRDVLGELVLPYHLLLGNHDHRGNFLQVFPSSPRDANGFVQFAFDTAAGRFICLDTHEPDVSWGVLCDKRLGWLKAELDRAGERTVHLFMHHPPFPVGIKRMDAISLRDPHRMADIVAGRRNIQHLYFGHLHRPIGGSWLGIPFTTMRATNHQVALNLVIEDVVPGSLEPPAYAVVFAQDGLTVVHFHDFLDTTATFNL